MQKFSVSGMSCAACVSRVEKAVSKVSGVSSCSVSLLTNSMAVEGTADSKKIILAVEKAGYGASEIMTAKSTAQNAKSAPIDGKSTTSTSPLDEKSLENPEIPILIRRLVSSVLALCVLVYISMGHTMWHWKIPAWFSGNYVALGLLQFILCAIILFINKKFFVSGFNSIFHGSANMDSLVALGSGVSFLYSTVVLFKMTDAVLHGAEKDVLSCMYNLYFEGAAMIVTLITVGKLLEAISKGRTTNALKSLMNLAPKTAIIIREEKEVSVPIDEVKIGDIFIVRPGMSIPVDGIVVEGISAVNEAAVTGESIPIDKNVGSEVICATMNINGFLKCRATKVGEDTTLAKIIKLVSDAATTKAPIAKIADKVSGVFVPIVISISVVTFAIWLLVGAQFSFALSRAIAVLVISCPCALGLATPVAIMVGNGVGAKNGILFKTSESLEILGKARVIALDKTGTITKGLMQVSDIICENNITEDELLLFAASLEAKSEHPISKAILQRFEELYPDKKLLEVEEFTAVPGNGLCAVMNGKKIFGGNAKYIEKILNGGFDNFSTSINKIGEEGKTPVLFACDGKLLGLIAVSDVLKDDSIAAIEQLKNLGLHTVMITGDNKKTANAIGKIAGVDEIISDVLPDGKESAIAELKRYGKVAMVGDGINDAPALTSSDIGIAIGAGSDVAIDAADVVLMHSSLYDVVAAISLSRKTLLNIKENLFWAFFYNVIGIPLAAGVYYHGFGWSLNPMFAAAAMSLSSFCVVTNALRLNLFNVKRAIKVRKKIKSNFTEEKIMEKTIKVEGMMCAHCEAHVKEALEKIKGIEEASPSHEKGEVLLKMSKDVDDKKIAKAVESAGYKMC